jgi:hypothetical protein
MMVCQECGNAAKPGDEFCASCGALLEWSGQPVPSAVAARQPVAEAGRPPPAPLVEEPVHTGPYCAACGVRNAVGRVFCRSCGERLSTEALMQPGRNGWWRRLVSRLRGRTARTAGERPRGFVAHEPVSAAAGRGAGSNGAGGHGAAGAFRHLHGGMSLHPNRARLPRWLALSRFAPVLVVAGLVGVGLGPARGWVTGHLFGLESKVVNHFHQRYVDVVPVSASASSAAPGHGAKLAVDGIQQTYWLSSPRDGAHARLVIVFASPQNIDQVGLLPGEPGGSYRDEARPQTVKVSAPGESPVLLSFDDSAGFQDRPVSLRGVTKVTVTIKHVYAGQKGQAVAIREFEFFNRVG